MSTAAAAAITGTHHDGNIEVDPDVLRNEDTDDYASSGYETSTASLTSSINNYVYENGRRYHIYFGADKNLMPTDEVEQDRLDLHHEIFLQILDGKLHLAPIESPHRILDVGTGTGIWAIDMADSHPGAEVIGTDLSPIQPVWTPPNLKFEVDDAEQVWTYKPNSFDFIHVRNLYQAIGNWPQLLSEIYRCTAPGGYIELAELGGKLMSDDGTMGEDNPMKKAYDLCHYHAMASIGRPPATGEDLKEKLETAGFVDVKVHTYKQVYGPWPKDQRLKRIGAMALLMCETGIEAYALLALTKILKMDPVEAKKICDDAVAAAKNKNMHMYSLL
ncbi:S-adenosyl-L-methionine-dependent methyltransferase [Wilcoxina mikolae CBS 423.85]|nr:S-adenosyl-L-methionine-dependent methyltransferase [Wilcoxina mikolae CBS 423.85]